MHREIRQFIALLCSLALLTGLAGCVQLTLAWADLKPNGPKPGPIAMSGGATSLDRKADWEERQLPEIRAALQSNIYGHLPEDAITRIVDRRSVEAQSLGADAKAEILELDLQAVVDGHAGPTGRLSMVIVTPGNRPPPYPVILMQTFCANHNTIPLNDMPMDQPSPCNGDGAMNNAISYVFGRYIETPPLTEILQRGYAVAAIHPPQLFPDHKEAGEAALRQFYFGETQPSDAAVSERWGSIAAWGWLFGRMADALADNASIDSTRMISWGHSRYGKAALIGAVYDERIAGVISHQSGAGGASLALGKRGETVASITRNYPHWFAPAYGQFSGRENALPVDAHHLLAAIAPRPIFLGNARRDVWSDPNASFEAARSASSAYAIYESKGLTTDRLDEFDPQANISFFIRAGTHGITEEDWPAFLDFLDAHFASEKPQKQATIW